MLPYKEWPHFIRQKRRAKALETVKKKKEK